MKEEYLHAIWRMKRLPNNNLFLTDGRQLNIRNTGWHNHDSGPDFFNGSIEIDGIIWNGNIEIHVKASDWLRHGHTGDEHYANVILHVVWEEDTDLGLPFPTLKLHGRVSYFLLENYRQLSWLMSCNQKQLLIFVQS